MSETPPFGSPPLLSSQEFAVLRVLVDSPNRVIGRRELSRRAGITEVGERRCDSLLVAVRRALGPGAIQNVRGRGWIIVPEFVEVARSLLATCADPDC